MKILASINANEQFKTKSFAKSGFSFLYSLFRIIILLSIGYIIIYPLFYMVITSLISGEAYSNSTRVWIPMDFDMSGNYSKAIDCLEYVSTLIYTFKNEILSALFEVISCAVIGYGFARFEFKSKKLWTAILFLTILVPDMMVLIPRMVNYSHLDFLGIFSLVEKITGTTLRPNILNTSWCFWMPSFLGVGLRSGFLIYIYIQFFKGLPKELEEAAWVDGSGPIRTFAKIALPSSGVVILTVSVFSLIWHWNDSLLSGMYLTNEYPIAMKLSMFTTAMLQKYNLEFNATDPESAAVLMAGCVLYIAPILIFYMFVQRGFIESIDRVGITG